MPEAENYHARRQIEIDFTEHLLFTATVSQRLILAA